MTVLEFLLSYVHDSVMNMISIVVQHPFFKSEKLNETQTNIGRWGPNGIARMHKLGSTLPWMLEVATNTFLHVLLRKILYFSFLLAPDFLKSFATVNSPFVTSYSGSNLSQPVYNLLILYLLIFLALEGVIPSRPLPTLQTPNTRLLMTRKFILKT